MWVGRAGLLANPRVCLRELLPHAVRLLAQGLGPRAAAHGPSRSGALLARRSPKAGMGGSAIG